MGGGYFYKIKNILLTDVKKFNIYLLLIVSLLIIGSVGYTSYSLFSYEVYSDSIYVSFKDTEKPVCVIGEPAVSLMEKSSTTTFEMNCTDNYTVSDKDLTSSNFTKTGDITVTSVTKEKVGKAMKYIITVTSGTTGGVASIKLNAGAVTDSVGNSNLVSNTSEVFVRVTCDAMSEDVSGANSPEVSLASNMIPVCYNSALDLWVKADSTNTDSNYKWYSYSGKKWANAVTVTDKNRNIYLNSEAGIPIPMNNINTMWVWIPRFNATGDTVNYNGGTRNSPGAFNITFVDTNLVAHDAFTFGEQNLLGFWIGKFEASSNVNCVATSQVDVGEGCNLKTIRPTIIPNATPWRGAMVSTFFYDILAMIEEGNQYGFDKTMDILIDTHMIMNSEWGAVAYLTQSIYGRCTTSTSCSEVGFNPKRDITGYGVPAGSSSTVAGDTYNTVLGMNASTTGNIYGIYDMSGGVSEYVMGVYWDGTKKWSGFDNIYYNHSDFHGWIENRRNDYSSYGVPYPSDSKYYYLYKNTGTSSVPVTDYESNKQHALTETYYWYNDFGSFVNPNYPWFHRGGAARNGNIGLFYYNTDSGRAYELLGTRAILVN